LFSTIICIVVIPIQANPAVGKDQPPDLAALVPSSAIILPDQPGKQSSAEVPKEGNLVSVDIKSKTAPGKSYMN
jgi:hypothetical protein